MEASISLIVQTIGELLTREVTSLMGVKDQIEDLQRELIWMQGFLKVADARKADHHDEVVRTSVAEIKELAYDAEDVIETFVLKVASRRKGGISNIIKRSACIVNEGWLLKQTKGEIEKITAKITKLTQRLQIYDVGKLGDEASSSSSNQRQEMRRPYPHIVDDNIVGLDDDIQKLVSVLVGGESDRKVFSICGMGGLGKTTLAKKIYRHSQVVGHFNRLAFVYVSQQFQRRKVWEDILSSLKILENVDSKKREEELAEKLYNFLKDNRCLVILDDIWSTDAWDSLQPAFPDGNDSNSKFLLTSRNKEVLSHADRRGYLYELQCLNDEESWKLFQKIATTRDSSTETIVDARKEELGKQIVRGGLPLAIKVSGGILATKSTVHEWQMVLENLESYMKRSKGLCTEDVLALSYDDLPPHLRSCFLYLCAFPEDSEIRVRRLILLWVAEGIVSSDGGEIMEDVAEAWFVELVERCMVQVGRRSQTLKIETCRMHDLMRDLCLSMAKKENFLCIIDDHSFSSSISVGVRRIVAHQATPFVCIRSSPLRSILFFGDPFDEDALLTEFLHPKMIEFFKDRVDKEERHPLLLVLFCFLWWKMQGCWTYLFSNFKLLRVLGFQGFHGRGGYELPNALGDLIHLRFLDLGAFAFLCGRIPSSLGNLRCLQTLNLRIGRYEGDSDVYVPDVIWKLEQLRHLYLPQEMNSKTRLKLHTLRNLQTLFNFNPKNCFIADLSKLTNLRKLIILNIEDLKEDLDENLPIITSKYLQSLSIWSPSGRIYPNLLARLLSGCVSLCELTLQGNVMKLPEYHHFSSDIAYICIAGREFEEDPMPTLEKLPNLKILIFSKVDITGKEMVCSAPHFPKLESLMLRNLRNLEEWKVEEGTMPTLHHLEISGCENLKMLPDGLKFITTLQELKIEDMPKQFKDKMVEGGEDFYKIQHVPSIIFSHIYGE